ncbi:hypothetical protein OsI_04660 [Oryza sativa Indica Group]|uniref:1-phosphatidylinositol 4-kinase n=1 Tax=Oryza sativa subsp. indica TaxID=39946 RepID=A2WXK9_ORYSI|nr:hypothetical protein OsI_04660 [Oryza sativa Indica Group]
MGPTCWTSGWPTPTCTLASSPEETNKAMASPWLQSTMDTLPESCRQPFSEETVEYIRSLDAEEDIAILRFHGWDMSGKCERILCVTTMLLKKGMDTGLAAFDMRSILCRDGARRSLE